LLTIETALLRACLGGWCPGSDLILDSAHCQPSGNGKRYIHIRAVWLVSGAAPGEGRPMLLGFPHADLTLEKLVLGGRLVDHVGHPGVPAGLDLRAANLLARLV
jgi:hypothetical protein